MVAQVFPNSQQHRRRIRLWMSMLIAFPMLTGDEFSERLPKLWQAIDNEAIPSTRFFIEWFVLLGLLTHRRDEDLQNLLNRLLEFEQPTGTAISLLTVTMHVGLKIENGLKNKFFSSVFDRILPWFLHNNHMRRGLRDIKYPEGYANMAAFVDQSDHGHRFMDKLKREYFLNEFDPLTDYNVQTIFTRLPEESEIARNESISMNSDPREGNIPWGEDRPIGRKPSLQLNRERTNFDQSQGLLDNYQQKLDPWNMELLDQDIDDIKHKREIERKKGTEFDTIIVASLVDRIPNLAGLSRTSEIFGATALVVPSLSLLNDHNFQNISMTSERWLDIQECKQADLITYLEGKRMEDYRIVAVEQSSQSHSLLYYDFPQKCCLVLGNENHGVPAEILHLVDDCIEIPQFGIIRSLNVHVSGSLVLWEARRQFQLKQNKN